MITAFSAIGDCLSLVYKARGEGDLGRAFFCFESHYTSHTDHSTRITTCPRGAHLSAHQQMALAQVPERITKALGDLQCALDAIPLFKANKLRPGLKMSLVGGEWSDPLEKEGGVEGMGGLTINPHSVFMEQAAWLMPLGKRSGSYVDWTTQTIQRWSTMGSRYVSDTAPYWYLHSDNKHMPKAPAIKAESEDDAIALYHLLYPHTPPGVDLTGFQRDGAPPDSLMPWTR